MGRDHGLRAQGRRPGPDRVRRRRRGRGRRRAGGRRRGWAAVLRRAIADPLTGVHAAVAALACWRNGGGALLDVSLCGVTAHALSFAETPDCEIQGSAEAARVRAHGEAAEVSPPRARAPRGRAHAPGADNDALREQLRC